MNENSDGTFKVVALPYLIFYRRHLFSAKCTATWQIIDVQLCEFALPETFFFRVLTDFVEQQNGTTKGLYLSCN